MTKIQKQRLLTVRKQILAEPELYDQETDGDPNNVCGSASCIRGWLLWNHDKAKFSRFLSGKSQFNAYSFVGLRIGSYALFGLGYGWPEPFRSLLATATTAKSKAEVAAKMIDYVIEQESKR